MHMGSIHPSSAVPKSSTGVSLRLDPLGFFFLGHFCLGGVFLFLDFFSCLFLFFLFRPLLKDVYEGSCPKNTWLYSCLCS